jgi:hypothetical protein
MTNYFNDNIKLWQEYRKQNNSHSFLVGMQTDAAILEDILAVSHKTKYIIAI